MKKAIKWFAIFLGGLLILLIIGTVALPFVFPLEKIKDFAAQKISESIHREVKISSVAFDLFSGIRLKGLTISDRPGFSGRSFVAAESIDLRYAFWPLFSRHFVVKELRLVKPVVFIVKSAGGQFNFSDLTQGSGGQKRPSSAKMPAKPPFDLFMTSFSITGGQVVYLDQATKSRNELKSFNLKISGFELALVRPIELQASATVVYNGKEIPLELGAKVGINLPKETIVVSSLAISVANESLTGSAAVSSWKLAPHLEVALLSNGIEIDPLLALVAGPATAPKKKASPGMLTASVNQAARSIPANVSLKGTIAASNIRFQGFKIDKINAALGLKQKVASLDLKELAVYNGSLSGRGTVNLNVPGLSYSVSSLKLSGFDSTRFINDLAVGMLASLPDSRDLVDKVYGKLDLDLSLSGAGVEAPALLNNLTANGSFSLNNGALKRLKTIDAIAEKIGASSLKQDLSLQSLSADFSLNKMVVRLKDLNLRDNDLNIKFNGGADLARQVFVEGNRLVLRASPSATRELSREYNLLRDKDNWLELTLELKGSLKKPIPFPILDKPIEAVVGKVKLKVEAKKVELENKAKEEATRLGAEAKAKAEEEKKRLAEEAKNQLKNLFNQ
ncbi:MAG: AsmA family protein [Candidatus Margulisbacteria bacterium]|nr:AsmA family protein [Candidatus Margulisiibacteriota bacterium]MBU1616712.1 AsmA family protein [Candidatus Margulisiibacteriota bacterium]